VTSFTKPIKVRFAIMGKLGCKAWVSQKSSKSGSWASKKSSTLAKKRALVMLSLMKVWSEPVRDIKRVQSVSLFIINDTACRAIVSAISCCKVRSFSRLEMLS